MNQLRDIAIIIPVYEASAELRALVDDLIAVGAQVIYVVDDGSSHSPAASVLDDLSNRIVQLCNHQKNRGKGRALKTGLQRVIASGKANLKGVITLDADGQHLVADVLKVAEAALKDPEKVVIGSRKFETTGIPLRSKFGNSLTKSIFKLATGKAVKDTQSGLRFLPIERLEMIYQIPGERYEFELQMLTELANRGIGIRQPEISTTYVDGNKSSHFRPLVDSARIYAVFIRYCAVSVSSAIADLLIFASLINASSSIVTATYIARVCSASFNFYGNRRFAFRGNQQKYSVITQANLYVILAFLSASISAALLQFISDLSVFFLVLAKAGIDISLFFLNFATQKLLIFRSNRVIR